MNKTTRLIRWQWITILLLIITCVTVVINARNQEWRIRTIAAINLRNAKSALFREKMERIEERQDHEDDQKTIEDLRVKFNGSLYIIHHMHEKLEKYERKFGKIDPPRNIE